jgi:hypothetical protein
MDINHYQRVFSSKALFSTPKSASKQALKQLLAQFSVNHTINFKTNNRLRGYENKRHWTGVELNLIYGK